MRGDTLKDLSGKRLEGARVIKRIEDYVSPKGRHHVNWLCQCDCGKIFKATSNQINSGNTKSCGCLRAKKAKETFTKHGKSNSKVFRVWASMVQRCENPNSNDYKNYGGRGIAICPEWLGEQGSENFINWALSNGYKEGLTIERKDVNGNYCPENCCWATRKEQGRNKRNTKYITAFGKTKTLVDFCEEYKINKTTVTSRVNRQGMTYEEALTTPLMRKRKNIETEVQA